MPGTGAGTCMYAPLVQDFDGHVTLVTGHAMAIDGGVLAA